MKPLRTFSLLPPWLLVVLAFVILIFAWVTIIRLSHAVPGQRLSAEQESAILQRRGK